MNAGGSFLSQGSLSLSMRRIFATHNNNNTPPFLSKTLWGSTHPPTFQKQSSNLSGMKNEFTKSPNKSSISLVLVLLVLLPLLLIAVVLLLLLLLLPESKEQPIDGFCTMIK